MTQPSRVVRVTILGRDYSVGCPDDEETNLRGAAELLDRRMREIRDSGRVVGAERIAIMAALNIANELHQCQARQAGYEQALGGRIRQLRERIDQALDPGDSAEG